MSVGETAVAMVLGDTIKGIELPPGMTLEWDGALVAFLKGKWVDAHKREPQALTYSRITFDMRVMRHALEGGRGLDAFIEYVSHQVYEAVHTLWLHELHEWFKVGGKHFIDPHPDGGFA